MASWGGISPSGYISKNLYQQLSLGVLQEALKSVFITISTSTMDISERILYRDLLNCHEPDGPPSRAGSDVTGEAPLIISVTLLLL